MSPFSSFLPFILLSSALLLFPFYLCKHWRVAAIVGVWEMSDFSALSGQCEPALLRLYPPWPEKFLCWACFDPPLRPMYAPGIIASVGEGMACLCVPSHTLLGGISRISLNATLPFSFQTTGPPTSSVVLGLCGTPLFLSPAHPQTQRARVVTKTSGHSGRSESPTCVFILRNFYRERESSSDECSLKACNSFMLINQRGCGVVADSFSWF